MQVRINGLQWTDLSRSVFGSNSIFRTAPPSSTMADQIWKKNQNHFPKKPHDQSCRKRDYERSTIMKSTKEQYSPNRQLNHDTHAKRQKSAFCDNVHNYSSKFTALSRPIKLVFLTA
jgi:hypothetical protein